MNASPSLLRSGEMKYRSADAFGTIIVTAGEGARSIRRPFHSFRRIETGFFANIRPMAYSKLFSRNITNAPVVVEVYLRSDFLTFRNSSALTVNSSQPSCD